MIINYYSRMKYARSIASNVGLGLKEDSNVEVPYTDGKTVFVKPYNAAMVSGSDEDTEWWYNLLHECYHNIYPEDFDLLRAKKIPSNSPLGFILNIIVDHNIECGQHGRFSGRDTICDNGRLLGVNRRFDMINEAVTKNDFDDDSSKIEAVFALDLVSRQTWQKSLQGVGLDRYQPSTIKHLEKIASLKDEFVKFKSSDESYDLAIKIKDLLEFPEAQDEQGNGQPNPQTGDNDGEMSDAAKALIDAIGDDDHELEYDGTRKIKLNNDNSTSQYRHNDHKYVPSDMFVVDFVTGNNVSSMPSISEDEDMGYSKLMPSNKLSTAIRKYLIASKKSRYEGGKRVGRMDKRRAWRATAMSGSVSALNVRKQAVNKRQVNTAVSVLIDTSGSMAGEKYQHAVHSAIMLNETLGKIGIPVEIVGFTTHNINSMSIIHKTFDSKVTNTQLAEQFQTTLPWMYGNYDGENILFSGERLMARKEAKKILIVLSDGAPVGGRKMGNLKEFTKDAVKSLEKHIDVHGIGIMSEAVRQYYKSYTVINNADQLEDELFTILKKRVLR